jgi:hypothetical protein
VAKDLVLPDGKEMLGIGIVVLIELS